MAMNKEMKHILFANTRKFVIEDGSLDGPNNVLLAATMNKNLERYGYTLDASALRTLSTQTPSEMQKTWNDLLYTVREVSGDAQFGNAKLFYPNFPEEVMRTPEAQLYLNSLFYYTFSQSNDKMMDAIAEELRKNLVETPEARLPLMENFPRELKIINKGTEQDLMQMMNARIHSLNMSSQNFEELSQFAREYPKQFDQMISSDEPFQSKETKVKIAMMLHEQGRDAEIGLMLKDSVDVLRYAAMLSQKNGIEWNNVELAPKDGHEIAFKLTSAEQRQVKGLLNNCKNLYTDIWQQEALFKRLMNRIKPTVHDGCPKRVAAAFDNLAHNRKLDENGEKIFNFENARRNAVAQLNKTGNPHALESLASAFSGNYLKNYATIVRETNPVYRDKAIESIKKCAASSSVALRDVLTTQNAIQAIKDRETSIANGESVATVYRHHGGKHYVRVYDAPAKSSLSDQEIEAMKTALHETATEMVKGYQTLGNVYIDPELKNNKAPGREMRDASGGSTLVPHSVIPADPTKNLMIFGINWGQPKGSHDTWIDVDTSVHFYGEDYEDKGFVSFSKLTHPAAVHSGDYTSVPQGGTSTEAIVVDKSRLREMGIRYAVQEVHCFSIKSFKEAGNCHFIMQQREGSFDDVGYSRKASLSDYDYYSHSDSEHEKITHRMSGSYTSRMKESGKVTFMGEVFEPSTSECNILLNSQAQTAVPFVYDAVEDRFYWLDYSLTQDYQRSAPSVTQDPTKMSAIMIEIEAARQSKKPDIENLIQTYAANNGTLVDDITQADTVFVAKTIDAEKLSLKENARVITAYDLDVISKEFSGNNDLSKVQKEQSEPAKETSEKKMVEPAIVKQLRFLKEKLEQYPYPIRESKSIDIDIDDRRR